LLRSQKTSSYWETSVAEYFVTLNEAKPDEAVTYFVVRPFWGHRLVIDLDTMTHLYLGAFHGAVPTSKLTHADEATKRIVSACLAEETRSALEVLTKASTVEPQDLRHYRLELESALRTVVLFRLTEAGPLLAEIELRVQAMTFPWWRLEPKLHQALRAAGKSPRPYRGEELPRYTILPASADQAPKPVEDVLLSAEARAANAAAIKPGMTVPRMVELIGLPDFRIDTVEHGKMCDYDIDGPSPHTLRVTFSKQTATVTSVEVITRTCSSLILRGSASGDHSRETRAGPTLRPPQPAAGPGAHRVWCHLDRDDGHQREVVVGVQRELLCCRHRRWHALRHGLATADRL
jgi:hypothetical protein